MADVQPVAEAIPAPTPDQKPGVPIRVRNGQALFVGESGGIVEFPEHLAKEALLARFMPATDEQIAEKRTKEYYDDPLAAGYEALKRRLTSGGSDVFASPEDEIRIQKLKEAQPLAFHAADIVGAGVQLMAPFGIASMAGRGAASLAAGALPAGAKYLPKLAGAIGGQAALSGGELVTELATGEGHSGSATSLGVGTALSVLGLAGSTVAKKLAENYGGKALRGVAKAIDVIDRKVPGDADSLLSSLEADALGASDNIAAEVMARNKKRVLDALVDKASSRMGGAIVGGAIGGWPGALVGPVLAPLAVKVARSALEASAPIVAATAKTLARVSPTIAGKFAEELNGEDVDNLRTSLERSSMESAHIDATLAGVEVPEESQKVMQRTRDYLLSKLPAAPALGEATSLTSAERLRMADRISAVVDPMHIPKLVNDGKYISKDALEAYKAVYPEQMKQLAKALKGAYDGQVKKGVDVGKALSGERLQNLNLIVRGEQTGLRVPRRLQVLQNVYKQEQQKQGNTQGPQQGPPPRSGAPPTAAQRDQATVSAQTPYQRSQGNA